MQLLLHHYHHYYHEVFSLPKLYLEAYSSPVGLFNALLSNRLALEC
jgi:hypothetical protein